MVNVNVTDSQLVTRWCDTVVVRVRQMVVVSRPVDTHIAVVIAGNIAPQEGIVADDVLYAARRHVHRENTFMTTMGRFIYEINLKTIEQLGCNINFYSAATSL